MKRKAQIGAQSRTKALRRFFRHHSTSGEMKLWRRLRNRGILDCKFRRQHPIEGYVVDFYCEELMLAIEIDGDSHFIGDGPKRDRKRQVVIEAQGVTFLRFINDEIHKNLEGVLETIRFRILDLDAGRLEGGEGSGDPSP